MKIRTRVLACAALLLAWNSPHAQDELPAVGSGSGGAPARETPPPPAPPSGGGTTIIGERESPIGLFITPWKESTAEEGMDRPARLLEEKLGVLDKTVFVRQIEYHKALSEALEAKGVVTPVDR